MNLDVALREVLALYPTALRPLTPPHYLGNAGGLSGSCFWRYESGLGPLIVKAWPEGFSDHHRLERIDHWLLMAAGLPFLSIPIAGRDGRTSVKLRGRFWQVSPWLRGSADLAEPPNSLHVESGFRALAHLHRHWSIAPESRVGTSPGLIRRLRETEELVGGRFDRLKRAIYGSSEEVLKELALRWLALACPIAPRLVEELKVLSRMTTRLQPCIRDTRRDHFLFERSELTGVVDFGAMDVDSVAGDLTRLSGDWLFADRSGALKRLAFENYEEIRPLDATERELAKGFETSNALLGPARWIVWHFVEGRVFDDPQAVGSGLSRGLQRLEAFAQ